MVKKINPTSHPSLRQEYFVLKKKWHVKMMHKKYKKEIVNAINALSPKRNQEFWKYINRLRKSEIVEEESYVPPEDWMNHYQKLLYDNQELHATFDFLNEDLDMENENLSSDDILGIPITAKEIHEQISKLKYKKAPGMESILNEMIKHGRYYLMPSLEKMFNDILNSGTFPTDWNIGVIKPIYKKKGDKRSPANYRGITLTSCVGKLFTSILQSRLNTYIEKRKILNSEQFGFRLNSRTTDSLFIL